MDSVHVLCIPTAYTVIPDIVTVLNANDLVQNCAKTFFYLNDFV